MTINKYYRSSASLSKNPEASRIAAENARRRKINNYRSQIGRLNEKIDDYDADIAKLRRDVERLRRFEVDRKTAWGRFQSEYFDRQRRLDGVQNFIAVSLTADKYHLGMSEDLNGGNMVQMISTVESTFGTITAEIQKREERIRELEQQINSLEGQISSLYRKIASA